jgi:hypothetical protein
LIFEYTSFSTLIKKYAIKNINRIRLARLSKSLLSFYIFNFVILISSFLIILAARFLLSILFKYYMHLFRRERRFIRKGRDITGMIYKLAYLCMNIYRCGGTCIRPAALFRLDLAPHPPLAKTSADP